MWSTEIAGRVMGPLGSQVPVHEVRQGVQLQACLFPGSSPAGRRDRNLSPLCGGPDSGRRSASSGCYSSFRPNSL